MFTGPLKIRNGIMNKDARNEQLFDYFLILDFEATCDSGKQPRPQEIIEFPVLKMNARTLQVESVFHQYVSPTQHPVLSNFCTELTGITQSMVEKQPNLEETLKLFHEWMNAENLIGDKIEETSGNFVFVTCGDWDLKTMLPGICKFLQIPVPWYFGRWVNVKQIFKRAVGEGRGMMPMLIMLGIEHTGRHHSGIDDCKNIARIISALIGRKGMVFEPTGYLDK